jgi:hypothetical protein
MKHNFAAGPHFNHKRAAGKETPGFLTPWPQ